MDHITLTVYADAVLLLAVVMIEIQYDKNTNLKHKPTIRDTMTLPSNMSAKDFRRPIVEAMGLEDGTATLGYALSGGVGRPMKHVFNTEVQVQSGIEAVVGATLRARSKKKGLVVTNLVRMIVK